MILLLLFVALPSLVVQGQEWVSVAGAKGSPMQSVHANAQFLWGIIPGNDAYYCERPCTGNWMYRTHNTRTLDVGPDFAWLVSYDLSVYRSTIQNKDFIKAYNLNWVIDVAAGGDSYIWFLDHFNHIFKWSVATEEVGFSNGTFYNIAANSEYIFAIDGNKVINYRPIDGSGVAWRTIPGYFNTVTAGIRDIFAIQTDDGHLYRCAIPCIGNWEKMASPATKVVQLDATIDALFAVSNSGDIYRHDFPLLFPN